MKNILNTQILKVISQQFHEEKRYMQQKHETSTNAIKKLNQRKLITELLEVEFYESEMVEPNEIGTSSSDAQTRTDLSLKNISDLENLSSSRKHTKSSCSLFHGSTIDMDPNPIDRLVDNIMSLLINIELPVEIIKLFF